MPNFHQQWSPARETWQTSEEQELDNQHMSAINNRNQRMAEVETLANERKSVRASSAPNSVVCKICLLSSAPLLNLEVMLQVTLKECHDEERICAMVRTF